MKVKMKTRYASPRGTCDPNGVLDLPAEEAKVLVEAGYAEKLESGGGSGETAAKRTQSPKGRRGN